MHTWARSVGRRWGEPDLGGGGSKNFGAKFEILDILGKNSRKFPKIDKKIAKNRPFSSKTVYF